METKFDSEDPLNLNAINFKFAFQFTGYDSKDEEPKILDDPKFVKIVIKLISNANEGHTERIIPYHKCTQDEYDEFYPIESAKEDMFSSFLVDFGELNCIDWNSEDPYLLFGSVSDDD